MRDSIQLINVEKIEEEPPEAVHPEPNLEENAENHHASLEAEEVV